MDVLPCLGKAHVGDGWATGDLVGITLRLVAFMCFVPGTREKHGVVIFLERTDHPFGAFPHRRWTRRPSVLRHRFVNLRWYSGESPERRLLHLGTLLLKSASCFGAKAHRDTGLHCRLPPVDPAHHPTLPRGQMINDHRSGQAQNLQRTRIKGILALVQMRVEVIHAGKITMDEAPLRHAGKRREMGPLVESRPKGPSPRISLSPKRQPVTGAEPRLVKG